MRYKYNILNEDLLIFDTSNDSSNTLFAYLSKFLTQNELEKINKYKEENDKITHVISYTIPKIELARKLNINPSDIYIVRKEGERPFYKDYPEYFYSVSHSNSYLGFVLSKNNIGLDIEQRQIRKFEALKMVSTDSEIEEATELDDKYKLWTFKEAYAKYIKKGLGSYLKEISYDNHNIETSTIFINHLVISLVKEKN